jgi:hypothetical protein
MMRTGILLCVLVSSVLGHGLAGCSADARSGYRAGGVYRSDVRTVSVPIFGNRTYERGLERDLTDAVIKEIQARTPYRVVHSDQADTTLTGSIVNVRRERLSRDRSTGLVQEMALQITVSFEWKDIRTGEVLAARRSFSAGDLFVPSSEVGEPIELGIYQAVSELATGIVDTMHDVW